MGVITQVSDHPPNPETFATQLLIRHTTNCTFRETHFTAQTKGACIVNENTKINTKATHDPTTW